MSMAVVVSHAMRRFPTTPPDTVYPYGLRSEGSQKPWSPSEDGESALSRSMRYADPWLYDSVRATGGFLLAPALVLCSCPDYINGTKRSNKKGPSTCKKCKGTRLPISPKDATKFGTVRCYPTTTTTTPLRAGTMRVSSSSRPSILPASDPYDLMRRSRLSVPSESTSQFRGRSPSKIKTDIPKLKNNGTEIFKPSPGRKSILDCNVNPYELMSTESNDSSITLVNGQRIRIRPKENQSNDLSDYEDVDTKVKSKQQRRVKEIQQKINEKESESNRFKSILKKRSTTFSDTVSNSREHSPLPAQTSGSSHFYLPMPMTNTPRKKVQFLVENEIESADSNSGEELEQDDNNLVCSSDNQSEEEPVEPIKQTNESQNDPTQEKRVCKLRRSISERINHESSKVVFHDTMALRMRNPRVDSRTTFATNDLERLDGLASRTRKKSPTPLRPNQPPPPPPPTIEKKESPKSEEKTWKEIAQDKKLAIKINNHIQFDEKIKNKTPEIIKVVNGHSHFNESIKTPEIKNSEVIKINGYQIPKTQETMKINGIDSLKTPEINKIDEPPKSAENIKINGQINEKIYESPDQTTCEHLPNPTKEPLILIARTESLKTKNLRIKINQNIVEDTPPSAPPRKRSNNKQPNITSSPNEETTISFQSSTNTPKINKESTRTTIESSPNKTIVQINSLPAAVHKLQIKNQFEDDPLNVQTVSVLDNPQRKTSIMITGDDCYSTVNVNDDVPLYQSSVVVKDTGIDSLQNTKKISSSVYITGNFVIPETPELSDIKEFNSFNSNNQNYQDTNNGNEKKFEESVESPDEKPYETYNFKNKDNNLLDSFNQDNIPTSDMLKELLKDPVEAVKRNLVPHVCGKSDMSRRPYDDIIKEKSALTELEALNNLNKTIEESFLKLRNYESIGDDLSSEHSSSTQYELMDASSECYTDHSNRSSVTEEELANRTKFYELLADSAIVEVSENDDHHYESIKINPDPIYEEIEIPPPLPSNPPPSSLLDDLQLDKEYTTRSIFEGASKYDILSYLVDAKERGIVQEDFSYNFVNSENSIEEDAKESYNRVSHMSTVSDSSEDNSLILATTLIDDKANFQKAAEVERNDSGVGSETSKSSLSKYRMKQETSIMCEDCEIILESSSENEPLICRKCFKKRSERKEIITEIVETEEKYSRDLQIILEEFYQPMLVAGLLTPDQLSAIFLNVEELLENSQTLAERLRDAVEIAVEQGDEDLLTVNIGKLFLEAAPMLHSFETYCVRQGAASLLLASLEKEKELLRIFLRVSQMENTMLRRMNLNSFLMVPVQRVTKYPLLLARLYKVTPLHHETREQLKEAQHKIELHLNHMNSETKDVPSKLWRRIGSSSGRRSSTEMDLVNIKLRKIAVDVLEWNHEEAKFALEGKLLFTQPTDNNWRKGRTIKLTPVNALLVINGKPNTRPVNSDENGLIFSRHSAVREAALLLVRDKNGRYSLLREPLYLDRCVIAADPAWQSYFEVQELLGKDTFIFKAEDEEQTKIWYTQLQFHAQGMGAWRKRRNALANIMINGMGLRS